MQNQGQMYLLMGYLGAGKTTFIRTVLNQPHGSKYAVIQNQFAQGQMGIEQPLITDESGIPFSSFLELPNGCICCSAKNDLIASVQYILANTDVRKILIQTNGLADPAQSIKQFWFDEEMKINANLHSVVSVFPVHRWKKYREDQLFHKQVIYSNRALLTFVDKSTTEELTELQAYIMQHNPQCTIGINNNLSVPKFLSGNELFNVDIAHSAPPSSTNHHGKIHSLFIKGTTSFNDKSQFECRVGELLWQSDFKVLRIKGVIPMMTSQMVYELQGVQDTFQLKQTKTNKSKYNNLAKLLLIGQNLDQQSIRILLKINKQQIPSQ